MNAEAKTPLIKQGPDGKLEYAKDKQGNRIPDFSRAGYMGGGVKLPDVPVRKTLEPKAGNADDTARIQAAIDEVGRAKADSKGFRGAVLLKKGQYRVAGTLAIKDLRTGTPLAWDGQFNDATYKVQRRSNGSWRIKHKKRLQILALVGHPLYDGGRVTNVKVKATRR